MQSSGKYLLWDFDGTLAHRPGQWTDTVMAVLNAADLGQGVDRETVRPFMNAGFPWHEPQVVRAASQPADAWWRQLEPVFVRAIQQVGRVGYDRASELAREVRGTYLDATAWVVYDDVVATLTRLSGLGTADSWDSSGTRAGRRVPTRRCYSDAAWRGLSRDV